MRWGARGILLIRIKGMIQVDHVMKPVLRLIFLFSTYKN